MSEDPESTALTALLAAWNAGDENALDRLIPRVHEQLRRIAASRLRHERPNHTLQTTALVQEVYVRVLGPSHVSFKNRVHFLGVCAKIMRQILIDYARRRGNLRHGGPACSLPFEEAFVFVEERPEEFVALDYALKRLAQIEPRKAKVIELQFLGGWQTRK